jgi:hypothetical protein
MSEHKVILLQKLAVIQLTHVEKLIMSLESNIVSGLICAPKALPVKRNSTPKIRNIARVVLFGQAAAKRGTPLLAGFAYPLSAGVSFAVIRHCTIILNFKF